MEASQIQVWPGYKGRQSGYEVQRLQHHVSRTVPERVCRSNSRVDIYVHALLHNIAAGTLFQESFKLPHKLL